MLLKLISKKIIQALVDVLAVARSDIVSHSQIRRCSLTFCRYQDKNICFPDGLLMATTIIPINNVWLTKFRSFVTLSLWITQSAYGRHILRQLNKNSERLPHGIASSKYVTTFCLRSNTRSNGIAEFGNIRNITQPRLDQGSHYLLNFRLYSDFFNPRGTNRPHL
ncbi:hypothetical protein BDC45DRAFT_533293 [Circinella umbellata]|nr:hypothetical protein BDC45DRAFT_533293 [Circinella umbellata]